MGCHILSLHTRASWLMVSEYIHSGPYKTAQVLELYCLHHIANVLP